MVVDAAEGTASVVDMVFGVEFTGVFALLLVFGVDVFEVGAGIFAVATGMSVSLFVSALFSAKLVA